MIVLYSPSEYIKKEADTRTIINLCIRKRNERASDFFKVFKTSMALCINRNTLPTLSSDRQVATIMHGNTKFIPDRTRVLTYSLFKMQIKLFRMVMRGNWEKVLPSLVSHIQQNKNFFENGEAGSLPFDIVLIYTAKF